MMSFIEERIMDIQPIADITVTHHCLPRKITLEATPKAREAIRHIESQRFITSKYSKNTLYTTLEISANYDIHRVCSEICKYLEGKGLKVQKLTESL